MALELWFRDDLHDALLSVTVAALGAAVANGAPDASYCRGILDAARGACAAFGVDFPGFLRDLRALLASRDALAVLQDADGTLLVSGQTSTATGSSIPRAPFGD